MEYYRDPKNQIQADIAFRLGVISSQYSSSLNLPKEKKIPATLDICVLQNVLTNCIELLQAMSNHERRQSYLKASLLSGPPWELNISMITHNTFRPKDITVDAFLRHLRNALSHPTPTEPTAEFPSTGYTTIPDGSGKVRKFYFISSPDTTRNRPKTWQDKSKAESYLSKANNDGSMPDHVDIVQDGNDKYVLQKDRKPFARIFIAEISVHQLHAIVQGLCNYLAQPIQESWDGETIVKLIA